MQKPTAPPQQDPKTVEPRARRYNPKAWQECAIPPRPMRRKGFELEAFPSWCVNDSPEEAMADNFMRASGALKFLRWVFITIPDLTGKASGKDGSCESVELPHEAIEGLTAIIGFVGESLDLAENAADAALSEERTKQQTR